MKQQDEDLIKEIETLKWKLEISANWMKRQVQESVRIIMSSQDTKKINSVWYKITNFFYYRPTRWEVWMKRFEAFFVGAAIILFWRGIWNLADHYLFPGYPDISALASVVIGLGILIKSRNFITQFLDEADEFE